MIEKKVCLNESLRCTGTVPPMPGPLEFLSIKPLVIFLTLAVWDKPSCLEG
jgi:hypothetical protein